VLGITPLTENMPGGSALRPGDVLKARNGKTIEVLNTDAEGRLILADGLSLAAEAGPDLIVDLATLTGACRMALGDEIAGLFGTGGAPEKVRRAAEAAGERVWPMPLPADYRKKIDSDVADMKNTGTRYGGAINAALLLKEFVGEVPWAHLDIAGPAWALEAGHYVAKGGTGFGVRTLVALAEGLASAP
jgi:leucyl aminopeptidase